VFLSFFFFHLGDKMKIVKMNVEWRLTLDNCAPQRGGVTMRVANVRAFRLRQFSRPTRAPTDVQPNQRPTHFYPLVLLLLYCIKLAEIWHFPFENCCHKKRQMHENANVEMSILRSLLLLLLLVE